MKRARSTSFEESYPAITHWVEKFGRVEIGSGEGSEHFVKAIDGDGIRWGGKDRYESIDDALDALEEAIKRLLENQAHDHRSSAKQQRLKRSPKKPRKAFRKPRTEQHRTEAEKQAARKVEKLDAIAAELRQGEQFSITRLTTLKSLCEDEKGAGAFALFLSRKIQQRMREKSAPKRYRELVNRAVRELKPYLEEPGNERDQRLWSLFWEIEAEQNEYENIPWGVVRNVKSFDLLVVEHALRAVLRRDEAPFWLYHAARDYTGRTDVLLPDSAPMVEDIARFWRKHLGIKR